MFTIRITHSPENIDKLRERGPSILEALTEKMTLLMFQLQSKIVGETIPAFFPNGAPNIAATVRAIPATLEGSVIVGNVEAGGPKTTKVTLKSGALVDYAAVQEEGIYHSYVIEPFNKKSLAFMVGGNRVFARKVVHPGLTRRPFMSYGLQEMEDEIISGLEKTLTEMMT